MSDAGLTMETLMIRNMVSNCCVILLKERFEAAGIRVESIEQGKASVAYSGEHHDRESLDEIILSIGLERIHGREEVLIDQIKRTVIELIHHLNNVDSIVRKSDYLVEKLGYSYPYLSRIFSAHETVTLERYIILQKIDRIKGLINEGEFSISEIAYMMDYSSVQYLSSQFHSITGMTPSEYKQKVESSRN